MWVVAVMNNVVVSAQDDDRRCEANPETHGQIQISGDFKSREAQ